MKEDKPKLNKVLSVVLGITLIVVGIILLVTPGPGLLLILLGGAVLLGKSDEVKEYVDQLKEKMKSNQDAEGKDE